MKNETLITIANIIWFSFWFALVFLKGISPWWFLFPVCAHWNLKDYKIIKNDMSSNNLISVKETSKDMWEVEDVDAETGAINEKIGKFTTLKEAIQSANEYGKRNEVEYGLEVEYLDI